MSHFTQHFRLIRLNPDNYAAARMNVQSDDEASSNLLLKSTLDERGRFHVVCDLAELANLTLADRPGWTPSCRFAFDVGRHSAQRLQLLHGPHRCDKMLGGFARVCDLWPSRRTGVGVAVPDHKARTVLELQNQMLATSQQPVHPAEPVTVPKP